MEGWRGGVGCWVLHFKAGGTRHGSAAPFGSHTCLKRGESVGKTGVAVTMLLPMLWLSSLNRCHVLFSLFVFRFCYTERLLLIDGW